MADIPRLGALERVDLRKAWQHEATSFTPWLALEENIALLSEAIGLDFSVDGTEQTVGSFSADILATDVTGERVLIENQLERTDHTHLGQCMTYAAGLGAHTVIWIAQSFRDEHRAAIEWLNEMSSSDYAFFAVEIELYRIGQSPFAPRFNVVQKPNSWSRAVNEKIKSSAQSLTPTQRAHLGYWTGLIAVAGDVYPALSKRMPFKGNWQTAETRAVNPNLEFQVNITKSRQGLRAEVYILGDLAKTAFDYIHDVHLDEQWFDDLPLAWERLDSGRDTRIAVYRGVPYAETPEDIQAEYNWSIVTAAKLAKAANAIVDQFRIDPTPLQQIDTQD